MANDKIRKTEQRTGIQVAAQFVAASRDKLETYIPHGVDREKFITSVFLAFDGNESLQTALATKDGQTTVMSALRLAACKGLSVNPQEGLAGFVPYAGKIRYMIFADGLVELALRDGRVTETRTRVIYQNDRLEIGENERGDTYNIAKAIDDAGPIKGFLAIAKIPDGTVRVEYMTAAQVDDWGQRFGVKGSKMWRDSFEGAGRKTVLRQLLTKLHVATGATDDDDTETADEYVSPITIEARVEHRGTSSADVKAALDEREEKKPAADPDAPGQLAGTTEDGRPF